MLRQLLTARWIGASLLVLIGFPLCVAAGAWQWDRAHQAPRVLTADEERAVPLAEVLDGRPADLAFPTGLLVRATGSYDGRRLRVRGVDADGAVQRWEVSGLVADAGGTVAVVRGLAAPRASAPTDGAVVMTGRLQPATDTGAAASAGAATATGANADEDAGSGAGPRAGASAAAGEGLDAASLAADGFDPRGYLVLIDQQPPDERAAEPVRAVPPPPSSPGMRWQNSMYAVQWWFFGGFLVFAWVRFFRDDLRASRAASTSPAATGIPPA